MLNILNVTAKYVEFCLSESLVFMKTFSAGESWYRQKKSGQITSSVSYQSHQIGNILLSDFCLSHYLQLWADKTKDKKHTNYVSHIKLNLRSKSFIRLPAAHCFCNIMVEIKERMKIKISVLDLVVVRQLIRQAQGNRYKSDSNNSWSALL